MEYFFSGFEVVLHLEYLWYMFAGVFFGMLLGFLPGLNGGIGIALMLPATYEMQALPALVFLLSIYTGSIFGGAVTAILFNTPGSGANIATAFDGYPMSKNGEPERAMGLALMSSLVGGLIGCFCLLLLAEPMANLAVRFGPGEMLMVVLMGLGIIGTLSSDMLASLFAGCIGLLMGTVGTSASGVLRGTFGSAHFFDGVPIVPAFLGFLAMPEIFEQIVRPVRFAKVENGIENMRAFARGMAEVLRHWRRSVVCSLAGVLVGIIPAAGAAVASLLCYNQSKMLSRHPERYGTGIPEGIVSCETANNASEGGALATTFVLGIPGSGASAILMGVFILKGWTPGPRLFFSNGELIYIAISSLFVQQFVMFLVGLVLCILASKIVRIPFFYLMPCVVVFMVLGTYAGRLSLFDCGMMLCFSGIGLLMQRSGYPIPPLILGLLLGSIADVQLVRIEQSFDFFWQIFSSPITVVLGIASVGGFFSPLLSFLSGLVRNRNAR